MAEFPFVNLEELASKEVGAIAIGPFGSRMKADVYTPDGVPVIRGTNIGLGKGLKGDWVFVSEAFSAQIPNCIARPGDIVFPHRGAIGEVAIISEDIGSVVLSTSMMKFRPDQEKADTDFLYYFFRSPKGKAEILKFASQVGTPGIGQPLSSLRRFRVPNPTLKTQRLISRTLSTIDDKVKLNQRMNENLEAMAQAIFKDWFVDFGPTRRKQEGQTDPVAILGGLLPDPEKAEGIAALFSATFNDDGLPDGWAEVPASELIEFNPKEPLKRGTVAPYTDMSSLPTSGSSASPPTLREFGSGMRFRNGDALLARITPCLENGKSAYVDFLENEDAVGWGSTEFIVMRSNRPVPREFAYLLVRHPEFRTAAINSMTGSSGRQRAQADTLKNYSLAKAPPSLFAKFGALVGPVFAMIRSNSSQNHTLAQTRDLLLPKLMSGEIRVSDAETIAAEV